MSIAKDKLMKSLITCPHCGCQYTPDEIFVRGELIGKSKAVIKDALGKVLYVDFYNEDDEPSYFSEYVCDKCDKPFRVEATLGFKTKELDSELDFSNTTTSLLD